MLVPYEEAKGMQASKELISQAKGKKSIGIIIGPEGGFEKEEIEQLKAAGGQTMSLGKRILRTETEGYSFIYFDVYDRRIEGESDMIYLIMQRQPAYFQKL